jgi:membrane fusion protein (multidrug efflux system)
MRPFAFVRRRPITTLFLLFALCVAAGAAAVTTEAGRDIADKLGIDIASKFDKDQMESLLKRVSNIASSVKGHEKGDHGDDHDDDDDDHDDKDDDDDDDDDEHGQEQGHHARHKIIVTLPKVMDITVKQPYVCQIHSRRHIDVCALEKGYLEEILVKEGQAVKKGDLMFKILPTLYQARLDAEVAEAKLAELEYNNTKNLADRNVVSQNEVMLLEAKLAKARANVTLAQAELNFTKVVAPFDGIVDNLHKQLGSLIAEGDDLTTLSDNSVMWVYFNVPESAYLDYMESRGKKDQEERIELVLANGKTFPQVGTIGAIEAKFNNQTGNIPFRADFQNPDRLLRHGQTGTIQISKIQHDAVIIPQRSTFELLDKRYVFVVDEKNVVHQRLITVENEKDDIFIIKSGLAATDKIVLDGAREVHDGSVIDFELENSDQVLAHLKYHAE